MQANLHRFVRWSRMKVCNRIFAALAGEAAVPVRLMIDSTPQGAPDCGQHAQKGAAPRCNGRTKGGLNSKRKAVCDGQGRLVILLLTEGQMDDHKGPARLPMDRLPPARELLTDRGYNSNHFHDGLIERGITPCIPPVKSRKVDLAYDKVLYRQRHKIENALAG